MDLEELKKDQEKLAEKVIISDSVGPVKVIAAADQAYIDPQTVVGVILVMDIKKKEVLETKYTVKKCSLQYIPGFLSYREAPAIIETYSKLTNEFDLLLVEGNGILHPRRMGIASHIGIHINRPTVGIAKSLLCGEVKGNSVYIEKDVVGKLLRPFEHTKPFFISPGHMITLQKSYELVKDLIEKPYKLPYPLAMANKFAKKLKKRLKKEES